MKAPVGLLSGRAVCVSRWRGFAPTSSAERVRRFSQRRLDTRTLSVISLCSMPAPPKGELLCAAARLYHSTKRARSLRHRCAMPHSPFCRCATSSPGAGEVFPQRKRPWQYGKVSGFAKGSPFGGAGALAPERASPFPAWRQTLRQCLRRPLGGAGTAQAMTEGVPAETPPVCSRWSQPAPSEMGPLAWRQTFRLKRKVSDFARGSLPEGAGKPAGFD